MKKKRTPFDGAFEKGRQAALAGLTLNDCPYKDKRKPSGKLSWSRSFQNAWRDGFNEITRKNEIGEVL